MPSSYPGALDALTNPTSTDTLADPSHSDQHADANDAVEAIEAELGTDPAGAAATVVERLDALPLGVLGYAAVTANQGSITTEVALTGLTTTVTVGTGRLVRVSFQVRMTAGTINDRLAIVIKEGANQKQYVNLVFPVAGSVGASGLSGWVYLTPAAGSRTYALFALRDVGSGTASLLASSSIPAQIMVEDLGVA